MGSPFGLQIQMDLRNPMMNPEPQDTLRDVLVNGPSLKTYEYLTKDLYYSEGLYNSGIPGHETRANFTTNLIPFLQEATIEGFGPQQRVPNGSSPQQNRFSPQGTFYPEDNSPVEELNPESESAEENSMDEFDILNYEMLDLSGINEVKECNILDIIEADFEDVTITRDLEKDVMWTVPKNMNDDTVDKQKAENNLVDLTRNQYFLQDKDTDKEARKQKGKSSMVRSDALAILLRCQVCGGRASGHHYGAETCGACKIFFARYNQKSPPHTCVDRVTGRVLKYNSVTAGPCPGCRLQKCFQVGMDIKASKKGRYSYKRKYDYIRRTKDENALQVVPVSVGDVIDDIILMASHISDLFLSCKTYRPDFFQKLKDIEFQYLETNKLNTFENGTKINQDDDVNGLVRYGPDIEKRQIYVQRFSSLDRRIKTYITFARKIPGFNDLPKEDQISIFKGTAVFLAKISEYRAYNVHRGLEVLPGGHVVCKDNIAEHFSEDYVNLLFTIAERCQKLNLNENERNLLKCVSFFSSEFCTTPEGKVTAEKHQDKMIKAFEHLIRKSRENNPLENCAKVIGNAMNVLGDIHTFKHQADRSFNRINKKYPTIMPRLLMEVTDPVH